MIDPIKYGMLAMFAMDIYRQKTCPPSPFVSPPAPPGGGQIVGYIEGVDTVLIGHPQFTPGVLKVLGQRVCYGIVVRQQPNELVVALRGTDGFVEWAEDGQFVALPYAPYIPLPDDTKAKVEQGFWGVYQTLQLTDLQGKVLGPLPTAIPALAAAADEIVVVGHSLGAALAAYMTIELARTPTLANRVNGIFYALPHPGDQAFADLFHRSVPDYMVYNYILDLVPRVPPSLLGYAPLKKTTELHPETAQASIRLGLACSHHIICYLAMINWNRMAPLVTNPPANAPKGEEGSVMCVKGPNLGCPSVAKSIVAHIEQHV